jgi:hypothetical protein
VPLDVMAVSTCGLVDDRAAETLRLQLGESDADSAIRRPVAVRNIDRDTDGVATRSPNFIDAAAIFASRFADAPRAATSIAVAFKAIPHGASWSAPGTWSFCWRSNGSLERTFVKLER